MFNDINQVHIFIKECIGFAFFDLTTDVYKMNEKNDNVWTKAMDKFIRYFQSNLHKCLESSLNDTTNSFCSLKTIQFFEKPIALALHYNRILHLKTAYLLYIIPINKFKDEINNFETQFNVR